MVKRSLFHFLLLRRCSLCCRLARLFPRAREHFFLVLLLHLPAGCGARLPSGGITIFVSFFLINLFMLLFTLKILINIGQI
jgi:hypothetical protein